MEFVQVDAYPPVGVAGPSQLGEASATAPASLRDLGSLRGSLLRCEAQAVSFEDCGKGRKTRPLLARIV